MWRELEQVLGAGVGVRTGVEQHGDGPRVAGIGTAIAGPHHARDPAQMQQPGGEHRAGVAGRDDRVGFARRTTARTAATRLESGFARTASAGLSAISIRSGVSTSGRPCVSRPAGP